MSSTKATMQLHSWDCSLTKCDYSKLSLATVYPVRREDYAHTFSAEMFPAIRPAGVWA